MGSLCPLRGAVSEKLPDDVKDSEEYKKPYSFRTQATFRVYDFALPVEVAGPNRATRRAMAKHSRQVAQRRAAFASRAQKRQGRGFMGLK